MGNARSVPVHVPVASNRSPYGDLADPLTAQLRRHLSRSGVQVVNDPKGAMQILAEIIDVRSTPGTLTLDNRQLVAVDRVWQIRVEIVLRDRREESLGSPAIFVAEGRAATGQNPLAEAARAAERRLVLVDEIVEDIVLYYLGQNVTP